MDLESVRTVYQATSPASFFSAQSVPGVHMLGLRRSPSMRHFWSMRAFITAEKTFSEASAQSSMVWVPSARISGSTMGQSPFS